LRNMFCRMPAPAGGFRSAVSSVKSAVKILEVICVFKLCIELNIVSYHYKQS
jgi:hypothetical protein